MCNFCRHETRDEHFPSCVRTAPDAEVQYDKGWSDGRRGREPEAGNTNLAYKLGWLRGDAAHDEWFNGGDAAW